MSSTPVYHLHNHIAYNCLPLWASPTRTKPWEKRSEWPDDPSYKPKVSLPTRALREIASEAVLKYVETEAVIGGTTAIQGSAKVPHYQGWLVRNVEKETFKRQKKTTRQSVREIEKPEQLEPFRAAMKDGRGFIYHLSEGTHPSLLDEYELLRRGDCLRARLIAVHATALGQEQFEQWGTPGRDCGSLVWSPLSNLWLYGQTTAVEKARDAGVRVCLGSDWSPSGSKNLLGELKVADLGYRAATCPSARPPSWAMTHGCARGPAAPELGQATLARRRTYADLASARERWLGRPQLSAQRA